MTWDPFRINPEDDTPPPDANPQAQLVRLSEWGYRPITWLWDRMIPRRKVTLLVGDQEVGKSYFAADLAARLTRGYSIPPAPPLEDGPGSVIILEGDDESDDTLTPRLEDAGADMDRVYWLTVDGPKHAGQALPQITLAHDVECLLRNVRLLRDCRLIIIDPITAFLDGMSVRNDKAVRRLFSRLTVVAKISNAAVLLIHHTRKTGGDSTLHRTSGAQAFTIASRVVFTIVDDPNGNDRKLFLPAKMNLQARSECPGRSFCIRNQEIQWDPDPIHLRPDDLKKLTSSGHATADRLANTVEWLRALLKNGPVPSREVHAQARKQGIPYVLLFKAKTKARARAVKDGVNRRWCWELIPDDPPASTAPPPAPPTHTIAIPPPD